MIKIDFHIHTLPAEYETQFDFDEDTIKEYVTKAELDAIAITNHNKFDLNQYRKIDDAVKIAVYPGIEIDLEKGHLLLIADIDDADDFARKCALVEQKKPSRDNSLSLDEFKQIFPDLRKYILIPHYKKTPVIRDEIIEQLGQFITAGEVTSPRKFMHCIKDTKGLVPVYFSDSRMCKDLPMPVRQTYLGCDDARSFSEIKNCLNDKSKVTLSRNKANKLFQIFDDGQMLSTGLNVILGERSSGKSHTLNQIYQKQGSSEEVKYIKQFSLVENDEKIYKELLRQNESSLSKDYLGPLNSVINDVIDIDIKVDEKSVSKYIESLVNYAKMSEMQDTFSKAKLLGEEKFQPPNNKGLKDLIDSTDNLISNKEFKTTIEKYVSIHNLTKLYVALMNDYSKLEQEKQKQTWLNELIDDIRSNVRVRSAMPSIADINLYEIAINKRKVAKFEKVVHLARIKREIKDKNLKGFKIVARSKSFESVGDLKDSSGCKISFRDSYAEYKNPYEYLQKLKNLKNTQGLEATDIHKLFVKIEYDILNEHGAKLSGGEMSEFNLLQKIDDAHNYEILLIDEPESSFDNLFLNKKVNTIIKEIAENMPVVIVTHNSTIGASIKPDYVLYTQRKIENGKPVYRVYSGGPASKDLLSTDGSCIKTLDVTMNCLEAGESAYKERKTGYENIGN